MAEPTYYTRPGVLTGIDTSPMTDSLTSGQTTLQQLFSNPNFLSLLAGVGARLDPQGVGGALGGATQDYLRAQAAQRFTSSGLGRTAPPTTNPLTPEGVAGPTTRTRTENADGTYSITEKGDAPGGSVTPSIPAPAVKEEPIISTPLPTGAPVARRSRLSDLPFLLAPQSNIPDLRGMTAEDAYRAFQVYNEGEGARQRNVGEILKAYDLESGIAARTPVSRLQNAQAAIQEVLLPGAAESQSAVSALNRASAAARSFETTQAASLGDLPKKLLQAQVDRAKDVSGTYTDYTLPSGQTVKATAAEVAQIEGAKSTALRQDRLHQDTLNHQAIQVQRWNNEDVQKRFENATKAEELILGAGRDNKPNAEKPEIQPSIDEFNAAADKPYIYYWNPTGYNPTIGAKRGLAEKANVPPIKYQGKVVQLTAREVARLAASLSPPITPKEYIDKVLVPRAVK